MPLNFEAAEARVIEGLPLRVWVDGEQRVAASQITRACRIDDAIANWYIEHYIDFVRTAVPEGRFYGVHDWSTAEGYTAEARSKLTQWTMANRKDFERVVIVMGAQNAIMRLGVSTARLALRAVGLRFDMAEDFAAALQELRDEGA